VQVHYDEGVAIHIGPEPCVGAREGTGEASAGDRTGQPSSRESNLFPDLSITHKPQLEVRAQFDVGQA
jgi:hypothetical protein